MEPFFERQALRFDCSRCGRCCIAVNDHYVFMSETEAERIRDYLDLSRRWFRRRYLERLEEGDLVAASEGDGRCVFLEIDGRCRIYPVRPVQCRTYPFWPEVVQYKAAWQRESRRCEGINRGPEVPVGRIRRMVKICLEQQD